MVCSSFLSFFFVCFLFVCLFVCVCVGGGGGVQFLSYTAFSAVGIRARLTVFAFYLS